MSQRVDWCASGLVVGKLEEGRGPDLFLVSPVKTGTARPLVSVGRMCSDKLEPSRSGPQGR